MPHTHRKVPSHGEVISLALLLQHDQAYSYCLYTCPCGFVVYEALVLQCPVNVQLHEQSTCLTVNGLAPILLCA